MQALPIRERRKPKMATEVILQLALNDVYGAPLAEKVDIVLRHQVLSEVVKVSPNAAKQINIKGLRGAPQGLYRMEIDPPSYQLVNQFVSMNASGITPLTVSFPVDPMKVKKVNFPA